MYAKLLLQMDNAAFEEDQPNIEVARIFRKLADDLESLEDFTPAHTHSLYDKNGNRVGFLTVHYGTLEENS